jgi:two-component system cell cycle sensor histidine kinase PleC
MLGEAAKLRQVFLNLLSNAMKFTEAGGQVTVASRVASGCVTISVTDTGIDMSKDDIAVALAPFGQVDSRLARRFEGTGIGLPLAKAPVELHGGVLAIESESSMAPSSPSFSSSRWCAPSPAALAARGPRYSCLSL